MFSISKVGHIGDMRKALMIPEGYELSYSSNGVTVWNRVHGNWEHMYVAGPKRFVRDWIDIMTGDDCFWLDENKLSKGVVVSKGCRPVGIIAD